MSEAEHDEPPVSVVVPTRNRRGVLQDALQSVQQQTHAPEELIVVDGGSSDGTRELLASLDEPRLRVVKGDGEGVSAARNRGIEASSGDLVAFLDADDVWRPDKLELQLDALEAAEADRDVALSGLAKDEGEPRRRSGRGGEVYEQVRAMEIPTYTSTLVARREALAACGGFDETLPCFEDWDLCLRLARDHRFAFVDEPLVEKGTSGDNISADPDRLARARRLLSAKHDLPSRTRARLLTDVGRTYCEAGRLAEGQAYLKRSLRLDPAQPKAWLALAAALGGSPRAYEAAMEAAYRVERRLARTPR